MGAYDQDLTGTSEEERRRKEEARRAALEAEAGVSRYTGGEASQLSVNPVADENMLWQSTGERQVADVQPSSEWAYMTAADEAEVIPSVERDTPTDLAVDTQTSPYEGTPEFEVPPPFEWDPTNPPPPPEPPPTPPPTDFTPNVPAMGELPTFTAPDAPDAAPDYSAITDALAGYVPPEAGPGDAPDYGAIAEGVQAFQPGEGPGEAEDFSAITDGMEGFQRPDAPADAPDFVHGVGGYETPEQAFGGEDIYANLETYAQDWLQNPNRYLTEIAETTRAESDARHEFARQEAVRGIDEWASGRGLVGSSYEGEQRVDLEGELDRSRRADELELLRFMTEAETQDRERAGRMGIDTGQFGKELGGERRSEAQIAQELALERGHLEITADDRRDAAEQFRAEFGLGVEAEAAASEARETGLDLSAAELAERAKEFRAELSLEEATTMAEDEARRAGISLSAAELEERAEEFRSEYALEAARTAAEQERATAGLSLDAAQMEEQANQFRSEFTLEAERIGFEAAFANVELQQRDAIQRAGLDLDAAIAGDRAALDRMGLELDSIRIQEQAIMDRAQIAQRDQEMELRAYEIQTDAQLRGQELAIDEARIVAEYEMRTSELEQREGQSLREEEGRQGRHEDWIDAEFGDVALDGGATGAPGTGGQLEPLDKTRATGMSKTEMEAQGWGHDELASLGWGKQAFKDRGWKKADLRALGFSNAELTSMGYDVNR